MANKDLDKKMQANILNYKDQIKTIESFVDAVRKTVGQYLGSIGNIGYLNMAREIYQNSLDEMQKEDSPCHEIWVQFNEMTLEFNCRDTGRGIPFGDITRGFTSQHTSSNYVKKAREFSSGRHGVGSKVTNACSKRFIVESYLYTGDARRMEFHDGHPWKKGEIKIPNKSHYQGTSITFVPAFEVMGEITTTVEDVLEMIASLLMLTTPGVNNTVHFNGIRRDGSVISKDIVNVDGILSFLVVETKEPVIAPIMISDVCDTMKVDLAFTYDDWTKDDSIDTEKTVFSFANMCHTVNEKSTHVKGFMDALCNYFRNYMNRIYLHGSKTRCISADIESGLRAVVSVSHLEPIFSGQAKEIFTNNDIIPYINDVMNRYLDEWCKNNANDLQKLCNYFKNVANFRLSEESHKVNFIKRVKNVSTLTGLPAKFIKAEGRKDLELFIVEGDSAISSTKRARDPNRQALFPIRGKIINAFTNPSKKVLANEEVCGIAAILGAGIGKNFDINKCKYNKIVFLSDADYDGYDIRQLLMKLFLLYFKPLVEDGRVYIAVPPLYSIKDRNKVRFFVDKTDYIRYLVNAFTKTYSVGVSKTTTFSKAVLTNILYQNDKYVKELEVTAMNNALDPQLLEYIIRYRNKGFAWIKQFIENKWKFVTVSKQHESMVIDGEILEQCYTAVCNDNLYESCKSIIPFIDKSLDEYYVNKKKCTLYELMKLFDEFKPKGGIKRYKGLGEMPPKDLELSTMDPNGERTLLRLTVNNIKKQINEIREAQSDISALLKKVNIAAFDI